MNLAGLALAVLAHAVAAGDALTAPVQLEWYAIQATDENREGKSLQFGDGLEGIREVIKSFVEKQKLDFDTFAQIAHAKEKAPPNVEIKLSINSRYTAYVKPMARDERGRIRVAVRIEETTEHEGKKSVRDALETTSSVASNSPLLLVGLKLERGSLIGALYVSD